jgi:hypothetical protein
MGRFDRIATTDVMLSGLGRFRLDDNPVSTPVSFFISLVFILAHFFHVDL